MGCVVALMERDGGTCQRSVALRMAAVRRDESFEIRPTLRQPAPELGTRARRTIDLHPPGHG